MRLLNGRGNGLRDVWSPRLWLLRHVFLLATVGLLAACSPTLMSTPVVYGADGIDPFAEVAPSFAIPEVPVFIATDREPGSRRDSDGPNWDRFYSNKRGRALLLARATVRIGDDDSSWPSLVDASRSESRSWNPPVALTGIEEFGALGVFERFGEAPITRSRTTIYDEVREDATLGKSPATREFIAAIDDQLARSKRKHVYVFVHGFNTSVRENTIRAASLWHYLGREGAMVSFEWPSRNSLFSYSADKASSYVSILRFRVLIQLLNDLTDAETIHIIAHSAGAPVVVHALAQLRRIYDELDPIALQAASKIGQVVLAAPDMDVMVFENALFDGVDQVSDCLTIYISTHDQALDLSAWVNGFARLGDPTRSLRPRDLEIVRGSDTLHVVDVAAAHKRHRTDIGHSYFHRDPWVSSDLFMLLSFAATPEERGLHRDASEAFWQFPEDYDDVAPHHARKLLDRGSGVVPSTVR